MRGRRYFGRNRSQRKETVPTYSTMSRAAALHELYLKRTVKWMVSLPRVYRKCFCHKAMVPFCYQLSLIRFIFLSALETKHATSQPKECKFLEGQITVKTITGTSFTVDLCPSASVLSLKTLIEVHTGIPEIKQNLHFNGERLHDIHTLGHYKIKHEDTVSLVPNLEASGDCSDSPK